MADQWSTTAVQAVYRSDGEKCSQQSRDSFIVLVFPHRSHTTLRVQQEVLGCNHEELQRHTRKHCFENIRHRRSTKGSDRKS